MKNIKIFVDCHVFDGPPQGTTTYLKGLYQELIQDKTKTFYFASFNSDLKAIFGSNSNVHHIKYASKNKYFRILIDIPRLIEKYAIDYAHFQYIIPPIKKCNYIVSLHDVLFLDFPSYFPFGFRISKKFLFKWSAKKAAIVLTVSEYSKKKIEDHFKIKNVEITPNAVDECFYQDYDKNAAVEMAKARYGVENYLIYISRWEIRKNHLFLLKVFVENQFYLQHHLVFIGDNAITNAAYQLYYDSLADHIKSKIVILNKVNSAELLILVRGASLSVYPSIAEGFGIPPLETAAAKVPTICSNTTAMADFDFFEEVLFDPLDENDLKEKISNGLKNQNVAAISEVIKARYNWKVAANTLKKIVNDQSL